MSRYDKLLRSGNESEPSKATWESILDAEMAKIVAGIGLDSTPGSYGPQPYKDSDLGDGHKRVPGRSNVVRGPNSIEASYWIKAGHGKTVDAQLIVIFRSDGSYHIDFADVLRIACASDDMFYDNIISSLEYKKREA